MRKGQMSLEYIIKMMILLVVVVVVIGLILNFYSEIKAQIKDLFGDDKPDIDFPKIIDKQSFAAGELVIYIESCYSTMASLPEDEQEDIVCYLLISENDFSAISQTDITSGLDIPTTVSFDSGWNDIDNNNVRIYYADIGNSILVSD